MLLRPISNAIIWLNCVFVFVNLRHQVNHCDINEAACREWKIIPAKFGCARRKCNYCSKQCSQCSCKIKYQCFSDSKSSVQESRKVALLGISCAIAAIVVTIPKFYSSQNATAIAAPSMKLQSVSNQI